MLGACAATDVIDQSFGTDFGEIAAHESYRQLVSYCQVRGPYLAARRATLERLNAEAVPGGPRFVAQDCDGDGRPDIE